MAIAGSPATAWEMARILEHSFQFYRRSQLQEMSVEGKVRTLSKLLRDNLGMVMQGVGLVVPLFATYDKKSSDAAKVFFYDAMGAQFEATDFASSGSGALAVRSVLYYENNWGPKPLQERNREESILLALRALDTAAEADTATGGVDRHGKIFPIIKIVTEAGVETVTDENGAKIRRVWGGVRGRLTPAGWGRCVSESSSFCSPDAGTKQRLEPSPTALTLSQNFLNFAPFVTDDKLSELFQTQVA
jgi:proteasome beta subunit